MVENTYKRKLIDYIKKNLKKSYHIDTLRIALVNQGYSRATVDEAAKEAIKEMASEAPVIKEKPEIEHEVITDEPVVAKRSFWQKIAGFFKK
jgi:alpha-beta hydrolase superfamily lysophospholipase